MAARFFLEMGGYAPTIGIIGTVVGPVRVLESLEEPQILRPLVVSAFVATLWGVLSANVVWLPMSSRIRRNSELRAARTELLLEGVAGILGGTNPRLIRARLRAMLPPSAAQLTATRRQSSPSSSRPPLPFPFPLPWFPLPLPLPLPLPFQLPWLPFPLPWFPGGASGKGTGATA